MSDEGRVLLCGIGLGMILWAVTVLPLSLSGVIPEGDAGMAVSVLGGALCGLSGLALAIYYWEKR